jgi:Ca2+-binding EF-hand superfamily protein
MGLSIKDKVDFPQPFTTEKNKDDSFFFKTSYFRPLELRNYKQMFISKDVTNNGKITVIQLYEILSSFATRDEIGKALEDGKDVTDVDFNTFLVVVANLKDAKNCERFVDEVGDDRELIETERSGGGV